MSGPQPVRAPEAGIKALSLTPPRVECVPHLVERGENFWTISRQYYNSGRYHRALWKANADRYPDINVLHVGDTIMIPACVEDLDQVSYIKGFLPRTRGVVDPRGNRAPRADPAAAATAIVRTIQPTWLNRQLHHPRGARRPRLHARTSPSS